MSDDPYAEPRIAWLHGLVAEPLADYARDTGRPHPRTTEPHTALEDAAALPDRLRRHGYAAAAQAARNTHLTRQTTRSPPGTATPNPLKTKRLARGAWFPELSQLRPKPRTAGPGMRG
ncbi:hypothetical protein [Kitasatospora sp. NBC_01266]|uniref:hypothetical protein n=1 Tax=Kitasatospora sp. NBC_01266 TaxID=2903572 RepID=UPI002E328099|nr:hypothetical protein [Kitasatospora sp. NBC_01266]